jgi:hypothetical protein
MAYRSYRYPLIRPHHRDQLILDLRRRGYTYQRIGRAVGISPSGAYRAFRRLQAGAPDTRARD